MSNLQVGMVIKVDFPFYVGENLFCAPGQSYPEISESWIPGCKNYLIPPDDSEFVADAMGEMVLTVIDKHKPGRYPERIFYTRSWVDPDGDTFGSGRLKITTVPTFMRRAAGYYYEYRLKK